MTTRHKVRPAGVLTAAALVGFLLACPVGAAPAPKTDQPKKADAPKEEPKKQPPKAEEAAPSNAPDFDRMYQEALRHGMSPEQARVMVRSMRQSMEMGQRMARSMRGAFPLAGQLAEDRLGVVAERPGATLAEQLDLPQGQGLVLEDVRPDSAAAKAGMKQHDILLEVNGKTVPDSVAGLEKQLEDVKAGKVVEAVVLRKGKKETIKGLALPEARAAGVAFPVMQLPSAMLPSMPVAGAFPGMPAAGGNSVLMTTFRTGDRFTTRHQEGSLIITVTGTVADGKAKVGAIQVQDGAVSHTYAGSDKVPDQYRDKVKNLLEMSEKGATRVEIKTP